MTSQLLFHYATQYGYAGLYIIVGISILGLPVPDDFLMTFIGFLTYSGQLNYFLAILFAAMGSCTAITVEYLLGVFFQQKVLVLLEKHAGSSRIEKVLGWYHSHGGKFLTAGYFIPGVRHISGYVAGMSKMSYRKFAFFAYLGATIWTTIFITLGRLLGSRWKTIFPVIHRYSRLLAISAIVLFIIVVIVYRNHEHLVSWLCSQRTLLHARYLSFGNRRVIILVGVLAFLTLLTILMGIILQ
ncbi:MAG: DedA family protein [Bacillota bacterium]|nr:DedA family protein [Bacillota bacterium]